MENNSNNKKPQIIINLDESSNSSLFSDTSIIHKQEFDRLKLLIKKRVDSLINNTNNPKLQIALDTITIYGSRGSGKTSFLYSLAGHYIDDRDIEVIDIIDPTMIEEKGHVFLTIISQIEKKVCAKLNASDCNPHSQDYCKKQDWRNALKGLSAGLPSLDGIGGTMDSWQDPEFIMDRGMTSVKAAMSLSSDFNLLVNKSLEILGKKAFILMLDDIDIDFAKGWPLLETVRKYLTTPKIITIVSGDLRLFSKVIRKKQWGNFGKALLKNEGDELKRLKNYDDIVTEMESQYLQKVLKPQYRIKLKTIYEKLLLDTQSSICVAATNIDEIELTKYYDNILGYFGIRNSYQREAYKAFITNLPLRTQIQFLLKYANAYNPDKPEINNVGSELLEVFLSDYYEKEIDIDLAATMPKYINSIILKALIDSQLLDEAYQLQPITTDTSLNSSLFGLSLLFSEMSAKYPYLIFDYFVKIGYIRNLRSLLGYKTNVNNSPYIRYNLMGIEELIKHAALLQDRNTRDTMCYTTSFMRTFLIYKNKKDDFSPYVGSICLFGMAETANSSNEVAATRLDGVFKKETSLAQQVAYIPASRTQYSTKDGTIFTYSIYVLLGAISEIIKVYCINPNDHDSIGKAIGQMSQIRAYPAPFEFINNEDYAASGEDSVAESDEISVNKNTELVELLTFWLKANTSIIVSPHVLGKISTRLFYAIQSIDATKGIDRLGDAMHRRIIAMMNAILIEDVRENITIDIKLSNNNPVSKDDVFKTNLDNLANYRDEKEKLKFSKWMLSCPLLLLYLDYTDNDLKSKLGDYIGPESIDIMDNSIYQELNQVEVKYKLSSTAVDAIISKPTFSGKAINIPKTLSVLRMHIKYNDFMRLSNVDIKARIRSHFTGTIVLKAIDNIKEYVQEQNIQW